MTLMEYARFSAPKARLLDRQFIETFDQNVLSHLIDEFGVRVWNPTTLPVELGSDSDSIANVDSDS